MPSAGQVGGITYRMKEVSLSKPLGCSPGLSIAGTLAVAFLDALICNRH